MSDLEQVRGCAAAFVRCQHVGRRFVVAFVPGKDPPRPLDPGTPPPASDKIIRMLERSLRIDRSTALYYLNSHSQSLRDAISAFGGCDALWGEKGIVCQKLYCDCGRGVLEGMRSLTDPLLHRCTEQDQAWRPPQRAWGRR